MIRVKNAYGEGNSQYRLFHNTGLKRTVRADLVSLRRQACDRCEVE